MYKNLTPHTITIFRGDEKIAIPPKGINYIVSIIMLPYLPQDRGDFLAPDTGEGSVVRDEKGRIVGVKRFISHQK